MTDNPDDFVTLSVKIPRSKAEALVQRARDEQANVNVLVAKSLDLGELAARTLREGGKLLIEKNDKSLRQIVFERK